MRALSESAAMHQEAKQSDQKPEAHGFRPTLDPACRRLTNKRPSIDPFLIVSGIVTLRTLHD